MNTITTLGIAVTAGLALVQPMQAGGHGGGGGHSFGGGSHFSGGGRSYGGGARSYGGGARSYGGGANRSYGARYAGPSRSYGAGPGRNYASVPRYSGGTRFRNPTYASNPGRFNGNRTTAYNSVTRSRVNSARTGAGRGA